MNDTINESTHHPTNKKPHECGVCLNRFFIANFMIWEEDLMLHLVH